MNNKILGLIFFALLGLLIAKKTILKPKARSFKQALTSYDAETVDKVTIQIGKAAMTTLTKDNGQWSASDGTRTVKAKEGSITSLITELSNMKTKQLVSRNAEKWGEYEVDDDKAKKIVLYSGGKKVNSLHVGRFNFNQQTRSGISYARSSDEDEIYALDGFIAMSVAKDFNSFRETGMMGMDKEAIETVALSSEAGERMMSRGLDGGWLMDGVAIDSTKALGYINALVNLTGSEFREDFSEGTAMLHKTLTAGGATIKCFLDDAGKFVLKSSQNDAYFSSDSTGIYKRAVLDFEALTNS